MTPNAIDRLCERIVGMFSVMGPSAFRLDAHQKLSDDVRAALERERERAEKLRTAHLHQNGEGDVFCGQCAESWIEGQNETHESGCLAAPEGTP